MATKVSSLTYAWRNSVTHCACPCVSTSFVYVQSYKIIAANRQLINWIHGNKMIRYTFHELAVMQAENLDAESIDVA